MTVLPIERGFSLVEAALALIILALVGKLLLGNLQIAQQQTELRSSREQLALIRESLLAYLMEHGRLPCPTSPQRDDGLEDCALLHGQLPWSTLGLSETDPWGNRLSYFAAAPFSNPPAPGELAGFTLSTGIPPANSGLANIRNVSSQGGRNIAIDLAAVVVMHGKNGKANSPDEKENQDADLEFVSDSPRIDFDDQLIWLGPALLKARLIAAGKLP